MLQMFPAQCRVPSARRLFAAAFPGEPRPPWLLQVELCRHRARSRRRELPGVGPGKQLDDPFPRASRRGSEGLYKDAQEEQTRPGSPRQIQLGARAARREDGG